MRCRRVSFGGGRLSFRSSRGGFSVNVMIASNYLDVLVLRLDM